MQLKEGTLLQNGEYKIIKVLGQGGFGITYLAEQTSLRSKVAIKEFFMKEYCNRDGDTSQVSVPSVGSKELVEKFREKFVKEAQNIASFSHNNIIKIYGVFMENNTAYYVMEYLDCGSLSDYLSDRGRLSEEESLIFIRQIADALSYIHKHRVNHLDVKPGNILLDKKQNAILIDFGLSKHYDEKGGQTSSTPVGISHGYAPLEQYKQGGVSTFSPSTDIYSLGATLYKLLTGTTPPEADDVNENGLSFPANVPISGSMKKAIAYAMQPKRKDRPQSIEEFLKALEFKEVTEDEGTDIKEIGVIKPWPPVPTPRPKSWVLYVVLAILLGVAGYIMHDIKEKKEYESMLSDNQSYITLIGEGDNLLSDKKYSESINKYEQAQIYEKKYTGTEYSKEFDKGASAKIEAANEAAEYAKYKGHEWVDLGLPSGIKWATCNVGASRPEDYGCYFAWGETREKRSYDEDNSVTCGKYYGDIGGDSRYDAARARWGGSWRLPTKAELEELEENCTLSWTTQGSKKGCKVTGPNGNSIFLPAAGYCDGTSLFYKAGEFGVYWSSTPFERATGYAYGLYFYGGDEGVGWSNERNLGQSVRPVSE